MVSTHHKPPHPLFLNTLILFLLLPFSVCMVGGHSLGQFLHFACDGTVVLFEVFGVLQDAVEVLLSKSPSVGEDKIQEKKGVNLIKSTTFNLIASNVTTAFVFYLMFLPAFALLLNLLLFLQFLCDAGLSQRLTFASLVGLGVKGGLQSCVTTHAHHHLLTQLWVVVHTDKYTNMDSTTENMQKCDAVRVKGEGENMKLDDLLHTCLWKLRSRRALSSIVALVRKSPAREPGRFSSSAIR